MRKKAVIEHAIQTGVRYIAGRQLPNGGFESFSSPAIAPFKAELTYRTTFVPALMLGALASTDVPGNDDICRRLAKFLHGQASPLGSFNYWAKRAPQRRDQPYPDDLDDTFCALAALYAHDPTGVGAAVLAKATKLLLATESAVGGPYRTWLVAPDSKPVWLDVDVAVNSNIAYFLTLLGSPLPNLVHYIDDTVAANRLRSPYYPSARMLVYYIARGYNGNRKDDLIKICQKLLVASDTTLDKALCVSALLRLDPASPVADDITDLLETQDAAGGWPAAAFCLDPAIDGRPYYNGASALTTALVLEALQLYCRADQPPAAPKQKRDGQYLPEAVLKLAKSQCRNLAPDVRRVTEQSLTTLAYGSNGREIIGLAERFHESLIKPGGPLPAKVAATLGLANLYGWLAYTIYDDFLDEEGKPNLIPVANVAMRRSLDCFSDGLPDNQAFKAFVRQTFDVIDGANAWEVAHCRFESRDTQLVVGRLPRYGNCAKLADRSIGHTLPVMAVLTALGTNPDSPAGQKILRALRHYLIARQLNDDAHDWPEDLRAGRITPIVAQLLSELRVKPGDRVLSELLAAGRRQFWHATLPAICRRMEHHVRLSRQALKDSSLLRPANAVTDLLDSLEASITDTLAQQGQAEAFLRQYKKKAAS